MKLEQLVLALGGLLGISGFFLPFLHLDTAQLGLDAGEISISGYTYVRGLLDNYGLVPFDGDTSWLRWSGEVWASGSNPLDFVKAVGLTFTLSLPIIMVIYSLGHFMRGVLGKKYRYGIVINLLFMGLAWGTFFLITMDGNYSFLGEQVEESLNFFRLAGLGYWLAFGGIFLAGLSLFFEKKGA